MIPVFIIASEEVREEGRIECPEGTEIVADTDPALLAAHTIVVYAPGLDLQKILLTCRCLVPDRIVVVADRSEMSVATDAAERLGIDIDIVALNRFDAGSMVGPVDLGTDPFRMMVDEVDGDRVQGRRLSGGPENGISIQAATTSSSGQCEVGNHEIDGDVVSLSLVSLHSAITPGAVLCRSGEVPEVSDQFKADLIWLGEDDGFEGRPYDVVIGGQIRRATVSELKHRYDPHNYQHLSVRKIGTGDCVSVTLGLTQEVAFDDVSTTRSLATFTLMDHYSGDVVGMGVLSHSLRRAQNVHRQELSIGRVDRERLNDHKGAVVWFTGLSGSGKSTVANTVEQELHRQEVRTYVLDGDNVRHGLNKDLGFTDADRVENIRRVAEVARLMVDAGLVVLTSFISPFRSERDLARQLFSEGEFFEVYVNVPLSVAEARDPKGLYKKARAGEIPNFTGIDSDYEAPISPELEVLTHELSPAECASSVCDLLAENDIATGRRFV